ncbi:MAG: metal-dependent hydrolase [Bacillota bacterium]
MAQVGIHALVGLVLGEQIRRRFNPDPNAGSMALGFLVGSIAPDLDVIPVAAALPLDPELALLLHRSFSHSLFAVGVVWLVSLALSLLLRDRAIRLWGWGAGLGVGLHILLDLLFWFTPVDLFWPASALGLAGPVDLWSWWETPRLLGRLLAAAEFGAMALYFGALAARGAARGLPDRQVEAARRMQRFALGYGLLLLAASFLLGSETIYRILMLLPMALLSLPASLYLTVAMREILTGERPAEREAEEAGFLTVGAAERA